MIVPDFVVASFLGAPKAGLEHFDRVELQSAHASIEVLSEEFFLFDGETKVRKINSETIIDKDVFGFQVTMDDTQRVDQRKRVY
jgi:hypothetical protein